MALAGEQHDVAGPGPLERRGDGLRAGPGSPRTSTPAAPARRTRRRARSRRRSPAGSSPRGSSSVATTRRQRSPGDPAHRGPLRRVALAARPEHGDQPAAARGGDRREQVQDGLRATPASGRSRRSPPNGWPCLDPLHPARDALDAPRGPRGPRPGPGRGPSPSATTASALWTLNRPASRSSSAPCARRRRVADPEAARVLLDAASPARRRPRSVP